MQCLASRASERIKRAFRPKTKASYAAMFKFFVAFCIIMKKPVNCVDLKVVLSYMECLACNQCLAAVIANHLSALKASFRVYNLHFQIFDHPQIKLFLKSLKINRPLSLQPHNITDISMLSQTCAACDGLRMRLVFKVMFLVGFFGFMRLSNLAPHSLAAFDMTRHFTGADMFITRRYVKLLIKWSKTIQDRNKKQLITLPKFHLSLFGLAGFVFTLCVFTLHIIIPVPNSVRLDSSDRYQSQEMFKIHKYSPWPVPQFLYVSLAGSFRCILHL